MDEGIAEPTIPMIAERMGMPPKAPDTDVGGYWEAMQEATHGNPDYREEDEPEKVVPPKTKVRQSVVPKVALPNKMIYHSDPGHGWLAVKRSLIKALGIERDISSFSYQRGDTVYLEEDGDSDCFFEAMIAAGYTAEQVRERIEERYSDNTPIRSYALYTPDVKPVVETAESRPQTTAETKSATSTGGKAVTVLRENGEKASGVIVPRSQKRRDMVAFADSQSGKMYHIPMRCCTRTKAGSIAYIVLTDDDLRLDNSLLGIFTSSFVI